MKYCRYLNYEGVIWELSCAISLLGFLESVISSGVVCKQPVLGGTLGSLVLGEAVITEQLQLQMSDSFSQ